MLLLTYFNDDTEKIVVVDAAKMGKNPGDYLIFSPENVNTKKVVPHISTHEGDILKLINMAKELKLSIPKIKILAIQPKSMAPEMGLSDVLQSRFMEYVDMAIKEVKTL